MQYMIASSDKKSVLVAYVNSLIVGGWIPQGGFCFCPGTPFPYTQAMIKHE